MIMHLESLAKMVDRGGKWLYTLGSVNIHARNVIIDDCAFIWSL